MRSLKGLPPTLAVIMLGLGCAAQSRSVAPCEPVPEDFALLGQTVYPACGVDRKARTAGSPLRLNYQPTGRQSCGRVQIDVVVDATGRPVSETARIVRSNDPAFAQAALENLAAMRYHPAVKDGQPVAQLVRLDHAYMVRVVAVPVGTSPSSVRRPRTGPPC